MSAWTLDELDRVSHATELQIASRRPDGSLRPYITIWTVRAGDDIYVRSAHGPNNGWYRRAKASGEGRIRAAGVERDVTFEQPDSEVPARSTRESPECATSWTGSRWTVGRSTPSPSGGRHPTAVLTGRIQEAAGSGGRVPAGY